MDSFDAMFGKRVTRFIGTLVILYVYYGEFGVKGHLGFTVYILTSFIYLVMIWTPNQLRTRALLIIATLLIVSLAFTIHFVQPLQTSAPDLLWPLTWLLAVVQPKYRTLSVSLFTLMLITVVILSGIYPFPIWKFVTFIGIYMGVRSRKIRQEAYQLNIQHLQELDEAHRRLQVAHAELLEASAQSMRYAALAERNRLAREIHDGIGHHLTSLIVQLQAIQMMLPHDGEGAAKVIPDMLTVARQGMAEVRAAVRDWASDESGLGPIALKGLLSQTQANSNLVCELTQENDISNWPSETGAVLYRILQESLTNILRHANANKVVVAIKECDNQVTLTISDDGHYTGNPPLTPGFGMKGIMERCKSIGGECSFSPNHPHGLTWQIKVPITEQYIDQNRNGDGWK